MYTKNLMKQIPIIIALACSSSLLADELKIEPFLGIEFGMSQSNMEYESSYMTPQKQTQDFTSTYRNVKIGAYIEDEHRVYVSANSSNALYASYDYIFYSDEALRFYGGGSLGIVYVDGDNALEQKGISLDAEMGLLYKIHSKIDFESGVRTFLYSPEQEYVSGGYYDSTQIKSVYYLFVGLNYNF